MLILGHRLMIGSCPKSNPDSTNVRLLTACLQLLPTATLTLCPVKLFCLFAGWGGPPPFDSAAGTWFGRAKSLAKGPFTLPQARLQTSFPALLACAGAGVWAGKK